ncbi:glycosyltransferase family 4 protein [Sphingopyxis chilensis]
MTVSLHSSTSAPAIAIVGNYPPRRCGIATFTQDLRMALDQLGPDTQCLAIAVRDALGPYDYPPGAVMLEIDQEDPAAYVAAAEQINQAGIQAVSLQHEFGIFGGRAGGHVLRLLRHLRAPVATTLHTVLTHPDADQRRVMEGLIARSHRLVVMAEKGRQILSDTYDVPFDRIEVVPHGIPDEQLLPAATAKSALGVDGRQVLLTFGLLSPNKGIEVMIEALPAIARRHPDILYLVVGATHPNLRRHEGERYRHSLQERAEALGVGHNVRFIDRYLELPQLLDFIAAADIYITPYLNEAQITSGTLAYAFGLGKPVVSSPYWYAKELLDDQRGLQVPFGHTDGFARAVNLLLGDSVLRKQLEARAAAIGRSMRWSAVARRYRQLLLPGGEPALATRTPLAQDRHRRCPTGAEGRRAVRLPLAS